MPTMKLGCNVRMTLRQIFSLRADTLPLPHFCSLRNTFIRPLCLIGACGSIHWHYVNSSVAQNQFVNVTAVAHATRLNNVKSTNASFTYIFFQLSNYDPGVN